MTAHTNTPFAAGISVPTEVLSGTWMSTAVRGSAGIAGSCFVRTNTIGVELKKGRQVADPFFATSHYSENSSLAETPVPASA